MPSTRDIRRRIKSVKNTRQITKAMELVAASKMKKAQQAAMAGRPYAQLMADMLAALAGRERHLAGRSVVVTAGPTHEAIDPVRYIANSSTGKMGYAPARRAARRGASVTLVSGPTSLETPNGVTRVDVVSALKAGP